MTWPVPAELVSITAILTYHALLIALIYLRPDLDPSWHTISEWALGPYGWLMSAGFLLSAVAYGAAFVAFRGRLHDRTGKAGLVLLGVCVIGTAGVGVFTTDPLTAAAPSARGMMHVILGTSALVLLPVAALLINRSLLHSAPRPTSAQRLLRATAALPLAGFLGFAIYTALFVMPLGPHAYGPGVHIGWPPRVAFWCYAIWLVAVMGQSLVERTSHEKTA
jgi:hypothetical membrane protein